MQNIAQNDFVSFFAEDTPLEVRNDIKKCLEDESHRYPHVDKNLQLRKMTKEELSSRRMTTLNPSAKSTYDLHISGKRNQHYVKSVGSLLFVCLFVLQSCKWLEGIVLESAKGL